MCQTGIDTEEKTVGTRTDEIINKANEALNKISQKVKQENRQEVDVPIKGIDVLNRIDYYNTIAKLQSVDAYIDVVKSVVGSSIGNLDTLQKNKKELRGSLISFFMELLAWQFVILCILIFVKGSFSSFNISESVLVTFMTAVFVETLGAVLIMIGFAFKSDEEVSIIKILNAVVEKFQKDGNEIQQKKDVNS